jgi:hypothetical protein
MKKILLLLGVFAGLFSPFLVGAQTFTVPHDTVTFTLINGGTPTAADPITDTSNPSGLTLRWHVKATNFPADWLQPSVFGICDNSTCYYNNGDTLLWRVSDSTPGNNFVSATYNYETAGNFNLALSNVPNTAVSGCYYLTVAITDPASLYTKNVTFMICNTVTAIPNVKSNDDLLLYPNPATNDLNVVYDANSDVKSAAIYNIIGKVMITFKVSGNSANLNLENIPSGIYFLRLINSHGDPVVTRKFTKQ